MAKTGTLSFLTLVLLLSTVGTAYYLYVSEKESYLLDRNFRLLALWSKKLRETTEEYKHQIQYIIISASPEGDEEQVRCRQTNPQQECCPVQCSEKANEEGDGPKICLEDFKRELEELIKKFDGKLISASICPKATKLPQNKFVDDQPRIRAQLSSKDKDLLRLIYEREREKDKKQVYKDTIQVDLSISKVLPHLITKNAFSEVILFDSETGKVHFQKTPPSIKLTIFVTLLPSDLTAVASFPSFPIIPKLRRFRITNLVPLRPLL